MSTDRKQKKQSNKGLVHFVSKEIIESKIYLIRGRKVMFDHDLAKLYEVPTHRLNEQVKRNPERFPKDFVFQLSNEEYKALSSHFASSKKGSGGRRYLPFVFTEQGVAMLSSVLKSKKAALVNVAIMRVFVKIRELLTTHKNLADKLKELATRIDNHDEQIHSIFDAIRQLIKEEEKPRRGIGFHVKYD